MHGGASTGPRTPEGRERCRRAHWKHGRYSREALRRRRVWSYAVQANVIQTQITAHRLLKQGVARGELDPGDVPRDLLKLDAAKHWRKLIHLLGRIEVLDAFQTTVPRRKRKQVRRAMQAALAMLAELDANSGAPHAEADERTDEDPETEHGRARGLPDGMHFPLNREQYKSVIRRRI